jgi:hypothetical protein
MRYCSVTGKVSYKTESHAKIMSEFYRERRSKQVPYKCPHCSFWHLTTWSPERDLKNKKRKRKK